MQRIEELNQHLFRWYQRRLGRHFALAVKTQLSHCLPQLPGQYLLQLALPEQQKWLSSSPIVHKYSLSHAASFIEPDIGGDYLGLPVSEGSVDVLILPHILQFYEDMEPLLKESDRVLSMGGYLITWGFNFFSLWGVTHYMKRMLYGKPNFPWNTFLHSAFKLKHALHAKGYEIIQAHPFFYRPPIYDPIWLRRLLVLETMGQCLWSSLGGAYFILAKKQSIPLTMRRARWLPVRPKQARVCRTM